MKWSDFSVAAALMMKATGTRGAISEAGHFGQFGSNRGRR